MKKLVWSETAVEGPRNFAGKLPQPPSDNGPIRNLRTGGGRAGTLPDPTYYGDSVVVAYRTPPEEARMSDRAPKATTNAGPIDATALMDDDLNSTVTIPAPEGGGPAWLQFEFAQPFQARAITIAGRGGIPAGRVLAGDDGAHFKTLAVLPGAQLYRGGLAPDAEEAKGGHPRRGRPGGKGDHPPEGLPRAGPKNPPRHTGGPRLR